MIAVTWFSIKNSYSEPLMVIQALLEYHRSAHNTSFDTFGVEIGQSFIYSKSLDVLKKCICEHFFFEMI